MFLKWGSSGRFSHLGATEVNISLLPRDTESDSEWNPEEGSDS